MATTCRELTFMHIEQLYARLEEVWAWRNRALMLLLVSSMVLWGAVLGVVQAPESISDLKIVTTQANILFVAAALIGNALACVVFSAVDVRAVELGGRVLQLYCSVGYDKNALTAWECSPLVSHHPMFIMLNVATREPRGRGRGWWALYDWVAVLIVFVAIVVLPAAATIRGSAQLLAHCSWSWWSVVLAATCTCAAIAAPIGGIVRSTAVEKFYVDDPQ